MSLHSQVKVGHSSSLEAGGMDGMQARWSFEQATGFNGLGNEPAELHHFLQVSQELTVQQQIKPGKKETRRDTKGRKSTQHLAAPQICVECSEMYRYFLEDTLNLMKTEDLGHVALPSQIYKAQS